MKCTRWSFRHIFNTSSNITHQDRPVLVFLNDRQSHSIDILHSVRAYAVTLHSDISSRGFCCRSHPFLPTFPLRPTSSRSSRSPTPRHLCTSPTTPYIFSAAIGASFPDYFPQKMIGLRTSPAALIPLVSAALNISDESQFVPDTAVCVIDDPILLLVCSSRERSTVGEPFEIQLGLPLAPSASRAHLLSEEPAVVAAPTAAAAVFSSAAPVRCKPCCATRNSCVTPKASHNCRCDNTRYHVKRFFVFSQQ